MINIINTGIGNFNSIHNMIKRINLKSNMTSSYDEVSKSKFSFRELNSLRFGLKKEKTRVGKKIIIMVF